MSVKGFPDDTKPLHEPTLVHHRWGLVALICGQFHGNGELVKNCTMLVYNEFKIWWHFPNMPRWVDILMPVQNGWHRIFSNVYFLKMITLWLKFYPSIFLRFLLIIHQHRFKLGMDIDKVSWCDMAPLGHSELIQHWMQPLQPSQ